MNTAETITAIIAPCALAGFALFAWGVRCEWWAPSFSMSLRFIPAHKRQPKNPVPVVTVVPGAVEQAGPLPVITSADASKARRIGGTP